MNIIVNTGVAARSDRRPLAGAVHDPATATTFITWSGAHEDSFVQAYDHRAGQWTRPVKIVDGGDDAHNYPTVVLAPDGHLLVFQCVHNVELLVSRSTKPHSAESWQTFSVLAGARATYPMPIVADDGRIFVFFRDTTAAVDDVRPMRYMVSADNGLTWTGSEVVLGSDDRADNMNEIYIGQMRHAGGVFQLAWTLAGGGFEGNKHDRYHRDIHYATFDPRTARFANAAGTDLGTTIDDRIQTTQCRITETPLVRPAGILSPDYIQLVHRLPDGRPVVLWMAFDEAGLIHDHAAVWTGTAWHQREVATGLRLKEIETAPEGGLRVYSCRDGRPDVHTHLLDESLGWSVGQVIPTPRPVQRIEVVTGWRPPVRLLLTGAASQRDVAIGDGDIYAADLD